MVSTIDQLCSGISDIEELFLLAQEELDDELLREAEADLVKLKQSLAELEFRRMFSGSMDSSNAYLDIQAGSGGTEAQDWAEMLLRMYLRWSEAKGFKAELVEVSGRGRRYQECDPAHSGRVRVWMAAHRNRRAPSG